MADRERFHSEHMKTHSVPLAGENIDVHEPRKTTDRDVNGDVADITEHM